MIAVGDTLGRYDLLARLRAGGMATLYLGKRVGVAGFTRPVAIKVIHPHLAASPRFVQMFVDEATLSAKIDDPHVVHVEELGEANGTYFLVMEYVDGASLAELLRELGRRKRALSVELAVWVAAQVAAGLHAAHEATTETGEPLGIVHRDVSPHNVLLAFKGHVKLIDFGVAKARGRPGDTQTGSLRGKLAYMPPEQAFGRSVDRRADVYALGVVLWEMLTMRRLFDADNEFALLERVRHPDICPPGQVAAGIPPALEQVVMAALAPDPERRPATAEELRARLMAAVPEASSKTAHDLSGVIAAIMPDTIKRARERLAEALGEPLARSEAPAAPLAPDDEALATMTVTMPDATILFEREHEVEAPHAEATARRARPRRAAPPMLVLGAAGAALAIVVAMAVVIATRRSPVTHAPARAPSPVEVSTQPPPPLELDTSPPPAAGAGGPAELGGHVEIVEVPDADEAAPPPAAFGAAAPSAPSPRGARAAPHGRRPGKSPRAGASPAHASSVEMHGGTPIFKKSL